MKNKEKAFNDYLIKWGLNNYTFYVGYNRMYVFDKGDRAADVFHTQNKIRCVETFIRWARKDRIKFLADRMNEEFSFEELKTHALMLKLGGVK